MPAEHPYLCVEIQFKVGPSKKMGTLTLVVALEFGGGIFLGAIDTTTTSNKRTERYRVLHTRRPKKPKHELRKL